MPEPIDHLGPPPAHSKEVRVMDGFANEREPGRMRNERLARALAEKNLTYSQVAGELQVDPKTVERWVLDRKRRPYPRNRYRLAMIVDVPEPELWPGPSAGAQDPLEKKRRPTTNVWSERPADTVDDVDRSEFLRGGLAFAASTLTAQMTLDDAPSGALGRTDVEAIRQAAIALKSKTSRYGGEAAVRDATQLCGEARDLLSARVPSKIWPDLTTAVGWLACTAGAACHDAGQDIRAARYWQLAQSCAHEAGNASLLGRVLGYRSRQAIWLGCPNEATEMLHFSLALPGLTQPERAQLLALLARAHAATGDVASSLRAVEEADEAWSQGITESTDDRPWIARYNQGLHLGETSDALCALAEHDTRQVAEATGRCQAAIERYSPEAASSRILSMIQLSITDMHVGDPHWAVTEGHSALDAAERIRSSRVRAEVDRLGATAARFSSQLQDAAELRDRCRELAAV